MSKEIFFPISRLFPNMITIAGLCFGLSSIRYAMIDRWELAITFLTIAAIIDGLDGLIARLLKATSEFGAQLDSLSDIVSFGIAPALIIHLWILKDIKRFGWAVSLFFAVCCALRLARFNVSISSSEHSKEYSEEYSSKGKKQFFTGIPAPAGAMLAIWPIIMSFENINIFKNYPVISAFYICIIAILMVSKIPTISMKNIRISQNLALPVMISVTIIFALLMIDPWISLSCIGAVYVGSIIYYGLKYWLRMSLHKNK